MAALEEGYMNEGGKSMLLRESFFSLDYIVLGLGRTRYFFKLTNQLPKLRGLLMGPPLTNLFPRSSEFCVSYPIQLFSQARLTGLSMATILATPAQVLTSSHGLGEWTG